jgi:hypothetical protein
MSPNILLILLKDQALLKITEIDVYTCMYLFADVDKLAGLE